MKRHTHRQAVQKQDLVEELVIGVAQRLRCTSDDVRRIVAAAVDYLADEYRGTDLYFLSRPSWSLEEIQAMESQGASQRDICRRLRISRKTLVKQLEAECVEGASVSP